jgi:hypothetical protein
MRETLQPESQITITTYYARREFPSIRCFSIETKMDEKEMHEANTKLLRSLWNRRQMDPHHTRSL